MHNVYTYGTFELHGTNLTRLKPIGLDLNYQIIRIIIIKKDQESCTQY